MVWKRAPYVLALISAVLAVCFSTAVAETVLLDFNSEMCGPCQRMRPIVRQLVAAGYQVRDVDIQRQPHQARQFAVSQVPTFVVLVDGREAERKVGPTSYEQLQQMLARAGARPAVSHASPARLGPSANNLVPPPAGGRLASEDSAGGAAPLTSTSGMPRNQLIGPPAPVTGSQQNNRVLIEATVKITVDDAQGKSAGSGTLVDSRSGEALVLTCGHIFRDSAGKALITVTLFQATPQGVQPGASYTGRLIEYDLERDLGLVSIRPDVVVRPARIAASRGPVLPGTVVTSVGCDRGENPTARESRVTANDRYQGPGNLEVAGAPVEGRSGGGLFNAAGELVGVCFAADHQDNEGLYASLRSVRAKFDSLGLTMVYQSPMSGTSATSAEQHAAPQIAEIPDLSFAVRGQEPILVPTDPSSAEATPPASSLSPVEQAAWEEIERRGANSEVICIIRPHDPAGRSEVITLNNASPEFVRRLSRPRATSNGPTAAQPATAAAVGRLLRRI